jgi:isopentenyldiphosphate isomerase
MSGTSDDELLDVVEPTGAHIGRADRVTVHSEGSWHQVFHCAVVRSAAPARLVLQRRRFDARSFPGLFDLSATGHLQAGEQPTDGVRELAEELGIVVEPDRLVPLGKRLLADDAGEGGKNRELVHVFALVDDRSLETFPFDVREVAAVAEIRVADLLVLLDDPSARVPIEIWDGVRLGTTHVDASAVIPDTTGYWTVLAVMLERLVAGERPLAL